MTEAILVISILMSPSLLLGGIVWYSDYSAAKQHRKWIEDFRKRHNINK